MTFFQSQSLNVHIAEPNFGKLTSMHFYAWKAGLKTGMYYLRTRAARLERAGDRHRFAWTSSDSYALRCLY